MRTVILCALLGAAFASDLSTFNVGPEGARQLAELEEKCNNLTIDRATKEHEILVERWLVLASDHLNGNGYNRIPLDNLEKDFSVKALFLLDVGARMSLTSGWLQGASTIKLGAISIKRNNPITSVHVVLVLEDLEISFDYYIRLLGIGLLSGKVVAKVQYVKYDLNVNYGLRHLNLDSFGIREIGRITIHWQGNIFSSLFNLVTAIITTIFSGIINFTPESIFKVILSLGIEQINVAWSLLL